MFKQIKNNLILFISPWLGFLVIKLAGTKLPACYLCIMQQNILLLIAVLSLTWILFKPNLLKNIMGMLVIGSIIANLSIATYQSLGERQIISIHKSCKKIPRIKNFNEYKKFMQQRQLDCFVIKKRFFGFSLAEYNIIFCLILLYLALRYMIINIKTYGWQSVRRTKL